MTALLDMHTHLPSQDSRPGRTWTTSQALRMMDQLGVGHAVVMTVDGLRGDPRPANDQLARACTGSDGRLLPACTVDPRRPDASDELERRAGEGFRAVKLHPWLQGFSPLEAGAQRVARAAARSGLPLLVHDGTPPYASPLQVGWLAEEVPEAVVVLAHGGLLDLWQDAVAAVRRWPNVYVTLCGTAPFAVFAAIVDLVGPQRITLGTDTGYGDPEVAWHRVAVHRRLLERYDAPDVEAMAYRNACRLLDVAP